MTGLSLDPHRRVFLWKSSRILGELRLEATGTRTGLAMGKARREANRKNPTTTKWVTKNLVQVTGWLVRDRREPRLDVIPHTDQHHFRIVERVDFSLPSLECGFLPASLFCRVITYGPYGYVRWCGPAEHTFGSAHERSPGRNPMSGYGWFVNVFARTGRGRPCWPLGG